MDTAAAGEYRQRLWQRLDQTEQWDLIIVGGGIVGAAVLHEAVGSGLKVLLLEQRDFAWGTSSRSSKMVHGGLRYIASGDFTITRDSVRERQRLLREAPGLIEPLRYLFADRKHKYPGRWLFTALLHIYDVFAGGRDHRFLPADDALLQAPRWREDDLKGACQYTDATTDDARLVLRLLQEAMTAGAKALNYCSVQQLLQQEGRVVGVLAQDNTSGEQRQLSARAVINATGAWVDKLRGEISGQARVRPLRGSHLIFPAWQLPVAQSITFMHPQDKRPVFIFPWEGVTVVGTTDLDHGRDLAEEPCITREEIDYLFVALRSQFPSIALTQSDVVSTFAGIRSVIGTGMLNPSAEKRDHCVWDEHGLVTVTGGKLTTFRIIARDTLNAAAHYLPGMTLASGDARIFTAATDTPSLRQLLGVDQRRRLLGRYGNGIIPWVETESSANLELIPGTQTLWLELRWAAANESVIHLDDLLLRRTRIGLLVPQGGVQYLPRIQYLCQPLLGWDDLRWQREQQRYLDIWKNHYSMPPESASR